MSEGGRAGFSATGVATLDRVLRDKYVASGHLPGALVQIWRRGELAHAAMNGSMDIARGKAMREDAIFRIYSMSKPITTVALMMLVEEGKLDLADEVAHHIPSWKNLGVFVSGTHGAFRTMPVKRPMRIIDLATHTSGLTYSWMNRTNVDAAYREIGLGDSGAAGGLDRMIEQLSTMPLEFSPGDHFLYSVATDVLGYLVQKISGQTFGTFLRERLFEPLGMVDTAFFCPKSKRERLTTCYQPGADGLLVVEDDAAKSTYATTPKLESGGGGLVSTMGDYMRFARMLLGGGTLDGVRLISPKTVALFGVNHLPGNRDLHQASPAPGLFDKGGLDMLYAGLGFSPGFGVTVDLARALLPGTIGEFGWSGAAETNFWVDLKEEMAVVFMTQVKNTPFSRQLRRDLRTLAYSAITDSYA